eukprot:CAMPEP_0201956618 /NCGR_PEP_ID=MMETSP0904-20121228/4054_1 /ASSEMBLY_ACC=CAM_ASM_000553 /TAXON_ID=420261 /ORGANISM="Thalassiosira antarctica, Strain CCMP982" /LENGTH=55 /DNA_ID=CAMNT_0048501247 /DNA_START=422 /DNA_END=586 /DNA_ORIENTATION=+
MTISQHSHSISSSVSPRYATQRNNSDSIPHPPFKSKFSNETYLDVLLGVLQIIKK